MSSPALVASVVVAAIGVPVLQAALDRLGWLPTPYTPERVRAGVVLWWAVAAATIGYVAVVEGRSLASVGVDTDVLAVLGHAVVGFAIAGGVGVVAALAVARLRSLRVDEFTVLAVAQPVRWKVAMVLTAGFAEELLFRGFLVERAIELTGNVALAGVLSVAAFALVHVRPGRDRWTLPVVAALGIGLVVVYVAFRDLLAVAVVHAAWNALLIFTTDLEEATAALDDPATLHERVRPLLEDVDTDRRD